MRFCKDCGTVLNLFGNREKEHCSACIQHKKRAEVVHTPVQAEVSEDNTILEGSTLCCENGKIILRSKEGWELWSCSQSSSIELTTLIKRAKRIYEIRLRRQKN